MMTKSQRDGIVNVSDQTTKFRLDQIEARLKTLGDRLHDVANMAHENKLRLDSDVQSGIDRESRLRAVEIFIEQLKGREMQNRIIMGGIALIVSVIGGGLVEIAARHL